MTNEQAKEGEQKLRVRFTAAFLRSTGQYTGPDEPSGYGPFARGRILADDPWILGGLDPLRFAPVMWGDGTVTIVNRANLEPCR